MASRLGLLSSLPEEDFSCPVCCDIYRDPVLLSCSHSFCKPCLQQYWEHREYLECPICRRRLSASGSRLVRNLVLKNLCEAFVKERELRTAAAGWDLEGYCATHGERLKLYCLVDKQPLCVVCQISRLHKQHACCSLEEAREDLEGYPGHVASATTEPGETGRIEPPGETVSWNSDWNVFWKLLCVGILFVIPLAFYLSSWRSNSEQVYWQTVSAFRLVLIGNTGQGRSSAGNTILGREAFQVYFSLGAVTTECQSWTGPVAATGPTRLAHRNHVTVVDTPGVSTTMALGHHRAATAECVNLAAPGPHAFLLVIRLGVRFTEEERNAIVRWIQENFGEESLKYTMVLFTGGDQLEGKSVEDLLKDNSQLLQLISTCRGRYHVFNNKEKGDHTQVTELLLKIEEMVESNGGNHFNVNTHPVREKEGSGVVVTVVILVAVGAVFKLIVDEQNTRWWEQTMKG